MELVTAVAAVLLPFPCHSIDDCFLCTIINRVDGRIEKPLQGRFTTSDDRFVLPVEQTSADGNIAYRDGSIVAAHMKLKPA